VRNLGFEARAVAVVMAWAIAVVLGVGGMVAALRLTGQ
jgi:hypothetical protein